MKKDVWLTISSQQQFAGCDEENIDLQTAATLYERGGKYYIAYEESELTGLEGTKTTVKLDGKTVALIRTGTFPSHMLFAEDERHVGLYQTPVGSEMAIATHTSRVHNTIGENDSLSAIVAAAIGADLLILLSDIDGLYDRDPRRDPDAKLIETVPVIDARILSLAGDKGSELATGGMVTKLHAAQIATAAGCEMVIANGEKPEVLYDIVDGRRAGTRFLIPHS